MNTGTFKREKDKFRIGVHTSIAGGVSQAVERAKNLQATTLQIFSHNPRQWRKTVIAPEEARRFVRLKREYNIRPVFIHASYLINLASFSNTVFSKSIELLSYELENADVLEAEYVVLHTGSAKGKDEKAARGRASEAIKEAILRKHSNASILLENTAGERGDITSSIETLAEIIDKCQSDKIGGICFDTCHAFSSGYDLTANEGIERLLAEIKKYIGLDKLKLIHLNDSRRPLGSGVDRHEHIGKGYIGIKGFRKILSYKEIVKVPLILETPKESEEDDRDNLRKVFRILTGQSLK